MIRVILAIVRVSAKYRRQSPEGFLQPDSPKASLEIGRASCRERV